MDAFRPLDSVLKAKPFGSLGNVIGGIAAYLGKSFMIYQPSKETTTEFKHFGIDGVTLSARTVDSINLGGYHFYPLGADTKSLPTVVYFHENAGTIGQRFSYFSDYVKTCQVNLVVFGYRGYSKSPGMPSMAGIQRDADAVMEKVFTALAPTINVERVIVHGKSIGGAVAAYVAAQEKWKSKIRGIILDSTFKSMTELVCDVVPSLRKNDIGTVIFENECWNTVEQIKLFNRDTPVLLIGVHQDEICPFTHIQYLKKALEEQEQKKISFVEFPEGGHNDYVYLYTSQYHDALKAFLASLA